METALGDSEGHENFVVGRDGSPPTEAEYDSEFDHLSTEQSIECNSGFQHRVEENANVSNAESNGFNIRESSNRPNRSTYSMVRNDRRISRTKNSASTMKSLPKSKQSSLLESTLHRWEVIQNSLADARSQNTLLKRQLKECQTELKTVQRQYKLQSVRMNRVIGMEAEFPQIIDRLTSEIRSLQTRLREKTNAHESGQRKIHELQHRLLNLEQDAAVRTGTGDYGSRRGSISTSDRLTQQLDKEKQKVVTLQKQLDLANKNHKHQLSLANQQIKRLRHSCLVLEKTVTERTKQLQEKVKLLELQNIYSQRIPKRLTVRIDTPECSFDVDEPKQIAEKEFDHEPSGLGEHGISSSEVTVEPKVNMCEAVVAAPASQKMESADASDQMVVTYDGGEFVESFDASCNEVITVSPDSTAKQEVSGVLCVDIENKGDHQSTTTENDSTKDGGQPDPSDVRSVESSDSYLVLLTPQDPLRISAPSQNLAAAIETLSVRSPAMSTEFNDGIAQNFMREHSPLAQGGDENKVLRDDPQDERKKALQLTLKQLNGSDTVVSALRSSTQVMKDVRTKSRPERPSQNPSNAMLGNGGTNFCRVEKSRERELWDELFGTKAEASDHSRPSSSDRHPHRTSIKASKNFNATEGYIPSAPKQKNPKRGGTQTPFQKTTIPTLPELGSSGNSRPKDAIHPKYSHHSHYFREEDGSRSDVEEEVHI